MFRRLSIHTNRISVQLFMGFVAITLLATAAIGIPSLLLIQNQIEQDAWSMVGQGSETTQALIAARTSDLTSLALLAAQRPTLHSLVGEEDPEGIDAYLRTLQQSTDLDLLFVCSSDRQILGRVTAQPVRDLCSVNVQTGFLVDAVEENRTVWLISSQPIEAEQGSLGSVVVGQLIDRAALQDLSHQTGLEYILVSQGNAVSTSMPDESGTWEMMDSASLADGRRARFQFELAGMDYFAEWLPLDGLDLETLAALPASDLLRARQQLTLSVGIGLLAVVAISSLVSFVLSRRISFPLGALRTAASKLRKGDLETQVFIPTRVTEVATVAYALEDARITLRHSLRELQKEKEWIEHLLGSIVEGIITLDIPGRITFFSQGAERITGWGAEEVLGRPVDEVFKIQENNQRFSQIIPDPGRQRRMVMTRRDGRQVNLAVTGAQLAPPEAGKTRVVLVLRDVSDEEAVHQLLAGFLSNITHEFRTPLSALAASIELLMDQLPDLEPEELNELLISLHLGVVNLQTLIDNLLEGSSIEAGRFKVWPRPTRFEDTLSEVTGMMQSLFDKFDKRLVLSIPEDLPMVNIDAKRTGQVLVNLLSNSVKFGGEGGMTQLSARLEEGRLVVEITDNGKGIPKDLEKDLFHRFAHYESSEEKPQYGLGLGLSVVKAIVEAQGGKVGAYNRLAGGATFWFTMPLATQTEGEA